MLFELINKAQSMLNSFHQKSQENMANENLLYDEMLKEEKERRNILEKQKQYEEKERLKEKEAEKKKRDEYIDLMSMDQEKENRIRLEWLNAKEDDSSESESELDLLKNKSSEIAIHEKDLLLMNLLKSLLTILSKIKNFNTNEFVNFGFKEFKKLNIVENNDIFKLLEKKSGVKYERLLSEKFSKYKETYKKNISLENDKYNNFLETLIFKNISDSFIDDLNISKKPEFYLDITQNQNTPGLLSKTISSTEGKTTSNDYSSSKTNINLEKPQECKLSDKKSRYQIDFEEIAQIGKGSFGEVIKVRNRLDGRYYAIKKIKIYQGNFLKKIMREVQTLSLMHHQYVLRYYQAWIEEGDEKIVFFFY